MVRIPQQYLGLVSLLDAFCVLVPLEAFLFALSLEQMVAQLRFNLFARYLDRLFLQFLEGPLDRVNLAIVENQLLNLVDHLFRFVLHLSVLLLDQGEHVLHILAACGCGPVVRRVARTRDR